MDEDLGPGTGGGAQVYGTSSGAENSVRLIHLDQLEGATASIAVDPSAQDIRVVSLALHPILLERSPSRVEAPAASK